MCFLLRDTGRTGFMKKIVLIFVAAIGLGASSAGAATVSCPTSPLPDPRDYFVLLTTPAVGLNAILP